MIMEKYITKNGIKYELHGEQYYPMLEISEQTNYEIGNASLKLLQPRQMLQLK